MTATKQQTHFKVELPEPALSGLVARLRSRRTARIAAGDKFEEIDIDARLARIQAKWQAEYAESERDYHTQHAHEAEADDAPPKDTRRAKSSKPLIDNLAYPPRGMDDDHAAAYLGIGVTKFREMVAAGLLPSAVDLDGSPRWDRIGLDRAFDDLKEKRTDPRRAGRARIQARLDAQKAGPTADVVRLVERKP